MSKMQLQSMHGLFGWTEWPFSKSNRRVSATIIVFCPAKQSQHALQSLYGPITLLILLPANSVTRVNAQINLGMYIALYFTP